MLIEGKEFDFNKLIEENLNEVLSKHSIKKRTEKFDSGEEYTLYFDIHRYEWGSIERAIEGYILNQVKTKLQKLIKEKIS